MEIDLDGAIGDIGGGVKVRYGVGKITACLPVPVLLNVIMRTMTGGHIPSVLLRSYFVVAGLIPAGGLSKMPCSGVFFFNKVFVGF